MARIRVLQQGFLYVLSANERDGESVGRGDATDKGGAFAESADALIKDTGNEVCFSGPIHIPEPGDKSKLPDTGKAAEASDAQETTEEVHNTHQEQSESLCTLPERLPLNSQTRRKRSAATLVPTSNTQQETKKSRRRRSSNWTVDETQMLRACKSQPHHPKGKHGWEAIAAIIRTRDADQCRQRWDTLQKFDNKTLPTRTSSEPAVNELNGATSSTHTVGKTNVPGSLPSSASPNLEVSRPELMPAAFSVEQRAAAVELAGWRQYEEAGIFIDSSLVLIKSKKHQSARKQHRCCSTYGGSISVSPSW